MKKFAKITAVALVAIMALAVLVACGYPSDPDKAKEKLEKQGYEVAVVKNPTSLGNVTATVTGIKSDEGKITTIAITYYKDADSAKEAYEKAKKTLDDAKKEDKDINGSVSRSGNQVIAKSVVDTNKDK